MSEYKDVKSATLSEHKGTTIETSATPGTSISTNENVSIHSESIHIQNDL